MEEIEIKFLGINMEETRSKLKELGATFVYKNDYRRRIYDFPDKSLRAKRAWLRLRDETDKITFTYKEEFGDGENHAGGRGIKELEVTVSDFEATNKILQAIGLEEKFYEENTRERYILNGVEVDIDSWPMIPPHLEIEGKNWEEVRATAEKLGLNWEDRFSGSVMEAFKHYGIDENDYKIITFKEQIKK